MSDYIDTREGWREVRDGEDIGDRGYVAFHETGDHVQRYWVRESPVPPLPNAPYTVIRVTWKDEDRQSTNEWAFFGGDWVNVDGEAFSSNYLHQRITSFEVVSEPRAVTAKAVLWRLVNRLDAEGIKVTNIGEWIDMVGREFGVES